MPPRFPALSRRPSLRQERRREEIAITKATPTPGKSRPASMSLLAKVSAARESLPRPSSHLISTATALTLPFASWNRSLGRLLFFELQSVFFQCPRDVLE